MANLKRPVLGIEIGANEVRIVEMRGSGNLPQILRVGMVGLPKGAMDGPRIVNVDAVAEIISGLHKRLGCQSRAAVVGMGAQSVVTRILAIPRVPDSELREVLEGELAHYQILRTGTGAFDYYRMETVMGTSESLPSVLLMAVEDRIAQGYRLAVEKAGLQILALEPITLALFRSAYPMLSSEPGALCLAITPQRSELSVLDHGQLRLYRRLEMGSNDFIQGRRGSPGDSPVRGPVSLSGDTSPMDEGTQEVEAPTLSFADENDDDDTAELETGPAEGGSGGGAYGSARPGQIIPQAAAAFANEVQRSLDYYRREFPNATAISRVILPTNDPEAVALSEWLSHALRMDVRIAELPTDGNLPPQAAAQLEPPQGLAYLGAMGLALYPLTTEWKSVPRFNLLAAAPSAVPSAERDRLTYVMIAAVGALATGFIAGGLFYRAANGQTFNNTQKSQTLQLKQQENRDFAQRLQDERTLNWIIKSDNAPIPAVLDLVTRQMPSDIGLTNFNYQRNGHIIVEGNARSLESFNLYYLSLMLCPHFVAPRYQSLVTDPVTRITHFKIETSLRGTHDALANRANTP